MMGYHQRWSLNLKKPGQILYVEMNNKIETDRLAMNKRYIIQMEEEYITKTRC